MRSARFPAALSIALASAFAQAQTAGEPLRAIPHSLADVVELGARAPQQGVVSEANVQMVAAQRGAARPALRRASPAARDAIEAAPAEAATPDGWMTLLAGLVAMLFIAWRKLSR